MKPDTKRLMVATASLIGAIIGVGIFGIPYAISRVGVGVAILYFVVLGGVQLLQHLFLTEAAMACPDKLRLVGLANLYLSKGAGRLIGLATMLGNWGSLLAYILVGGTFLHVLLSPFLGGTEFVYQLIWAAVGFVIIYRGLTFISKIDFWATVGLVIALTVILAAGLTKIDPVNFVWYTGQDFIMPYGIILFSLGGLTAVLEMEDILAGEHKNYRKAVIVGTLVAAALTAAFGFIVYGLSGSSTMPDAVSGMKRVLGPGITVLASLFGFFAVATSFFATGEHLRGTLRHDYGLSKPVAWMLTAVVPVGIFLYGAKNFVNIISFSGAVFGGIQAIILAFLYVAVTKKKLVANPLRVPISVAYACVALLALGAGYEVIVTAQKLLT